MTHFETLIQSILDKHGLPLKRKALRLRTYAASRARAVVAAELAATGHSLKVIGDVIGLKTPESIKYAIRCGHKIINVVPAEPFQGVVGRKRAGGRPPA